MALAGLRMRSGVLLAVCLGHVGLILLLSHSAIGPRWRDGTRDVQQEPMLLVLVDDRLWERRSSARDETVSLSERVTLEAPPSLIGPEPQFEIVEPITPPIDWYTDAKRAAADVVRKQIARDTLVARSRERLSDHPTAMNLPTLPERRENRNGNTEHYAGETITWIDELCYYSTAPRVGPDAGPLTLALPVCKKSTRKSLRPPSKRFEGEEDSIPLQTDKDALPRLGGR